MTKINVILAWCEGFGIGFKNTLPWRIPGDLKRFSRLTKGEGKSAVIMGKNTWYSLPSRPLKDRINIIVSSKILPRYNILESKHLVAQSLNQAINLCKSNSIETCWIIGGQKLLESLQMDLVDTAEITIINKKYECDTFVPTQVSRYILDTMTLKNTEFFNNEDISVEYRTYVRPE